MSGKKIIVLSGGTSAEREVSLKSGSQIHSALIQLGHQVELEDLLTICLLYTSPSPRDKRQSRMPSSA